MLVKNAIPLAILTMIMSIPLYLFYYTKPGILSPGIVYLFLYFWTLGSVLIVPLLLIVEVLVLKHFLGSADVGQRSREFTYTITAIFIGVGSFAVLLIFHKLFSLSNGIK